MSLLKLNPVPDVDIMHRCHQDNADSSFTGRNARNVFRILESAIAVNYRMHLKGQGEDHSTLETLKPCWEKEKKGARSSGWLIERELKELGR